MIAAKHHGGHPFTAACAVVALLLGALALSGCLESRADQRQTQFDEKLAKRVILTRNCGSCHRLQARGLSLHGKVGPDLTRQARRNRSEEWLRRQLVNPLSIPDSEVLENFRGKQKLMPPLRASEAELDAVIAFLQTLD